MSKQEKQEDFAKLAIIEHLAGQIVDLSAEYDSVITGCARAIMGRTWRIRSGDYDDDHDDIIF